MERIGDQATDIAEIAQFIRGRHQQTNETLRTMAEEAISMVQEAVRSFVERDLALARKVIDDDDVVDRLFDETKTRLITFIAQDCKIPGAHRRPCHQHCRVGPVFHHRPA